MKNTIYAELLILTVKDLSDMFIHGIAVLIGISESYQFTTFLQYHCAFHSKLINFILFMQGQIQNTISTLEQSARMDIRP